MKVVNLKQAILQAWKERWSDYQWAINMKRFFPRGATWDILNLAGPGPRGEREPRRFLLWGCLLRRCTEVDPWLSQPKAQPVVGSWPGRAGVSAACSRTYGELWDHDTVL